MGQQTSNFEEQKAEHDVAIKLTQDLARKLKDAEIKIQQRDQSLAALTESAKDMSRSNEEKEQRIEGLEYQQTQMKQSF